MLTVTITSPEGESTEAAIAQSRALIGRGRDCAVQLNGWRVGRSHARLIVSAQGVHIEDLGNMTGTWINGARVVQYGPLDFSDEIAIAGYKLRVKAATANQPVVSSGDDTATPDNASMSAGESDRSNRFAWASTSRFADQTNGHANEQATDEAIPELPPSSIVAHPASAQPVMAAQRVDASLIESPHELAVRSDPARFTWRKRIHELLLETIDLRRRDLTRMTDAELRNETETLIREIIAAQRDLPRQLDRDALCREVLNEAVGLGPLEELLADEAVSEIMVNRHDEIFVERNGRLALHPLTFTSDRAVLGVIERIVAPLGRRIDESSPMVDARLKDGSRVNAIIPPLALKGPTLTIRKFMKKRLGVDDMLGFDTLSPAMANFLHTCVVHRKNLLISGGTGSGKTSLLNVLSNFIPDGERIITIEDAAELRLNHSHLVSLESRPSNVEGRGQISIRDLVKNALRMRPDRIVVGECRGGEALDMLQAMNTGHDGSMTTLHANTPRDGLARLETLVLMAGMDLPLTAIREQIASAVDIVIQQTRLACGARKITSITEITGIEAGKVQMQELFRFERRGHDATGKTLGQFTGCNAVPTFYDDLRARGAAVDLSIFDRVSA